MRTEGRKGKERARGAQRERNKIGSRFSSGNWLPVAFMNSGSERTAIFQEVKFPFNGPNSHRGKTLAFASWPTALFLFSCPSSQICKGRRSGGTPLPHPSRLSRRTIPGIRVFYGYSRSAYKRRPSRHQKREYIVDAIETLRIVSGTQVASVIVEHLSCSLPKVRR